MTLSQPVSLRSLALGKIGLRGLYVFALAAALSVLGAVLGGVNLGVASVLLRLGLWVVVVAAYGAFWFAAAVAVNAVGRSSAANALTLASVWLGFVLLIPALLNVTVKALHPVPSRVDMIQAMRTASDSVTARRSKLMARYLEDHPELVAPGQDSTAQLAMRDVAMTEELERQVQPVLARFDEQVKRQQELVDVYRFLSPAVLTQAALYDLAGTNSSRHQYFLRVVEQYHREWHEHFHAKILAGAKLEQRDVDLLPTFAFREEPTSAVITRASLSLAGLLAAALIAGLAALRLLRRYQIAA
jgi:ABC-2 type transport system permease protein